MIVCCGCSYTRYKYPCWPAYVQWFEKEEIKNLGASVFHDEDNARMNEK